MYLYKYICIDITIDKMIIKHEHYAEEGNSNSGDCDYSAKKTLYFSGRDGQVFEERKKLGFPTERITTDGGINI